ncbi:CPBP family intramembrane glutamic endopeptidase [Microbispora triticiradicis]|uniref:CPBP family intramembrane metalloprotease n=2 Tax=Microbispora TaxID=2005 RepID=A0ABY3M6H0_9ACTN|nr:MULTISPECIES: CPBP family intramembrane glutamic endopeptidase [Microbispora]TLP66490.1 CPBP family intramembrane metalloprotease [Microbispora fusca]TYB68274.1 CPBP family intramembrane metalloprotease [Microbispora tritici]
MTVPSFTVPSLFLAVPLTAYLTFVSPWLGRRQYDRLARRRADDPRALVRAYRIWIGEEWAWIAVTALILALSPDAGLRDLGFIRPDDFGKVAVMTAGLGGALLAGSLALRHASRSGRAVPGQEAVAALLPRTPAERWHAVAMAVTAGVCEEVVYRGLLIALGVGVLGLNPSVAAVLALAVFVAGHLYQGWRGMAGVALLGLWFTAMYLATDSLLLPIVAHVLIDVRGLVFVPAPPPEKVGHAA